MQLTPDLNYLLPRKVELMRVGPNGDCGYVIPKSAALSTRSLYSIGISTNWDFEIQMARLNPRLNISAFDRTSGWQVFGFIAVRDLLRGDPSVVDGQPWSERLTSFRKYLLLSFRFFMFFRGRRRFGRKWVRGEKLRSDEVSFHETVGGTFNSAPSLLKIDIEGGEYDFIDDLIHQVGLNHQKISCLIMELHDTFTRRTEFERLVKGVSHWLPIVHLHANNCAGVAADGLPEVIEITPQKQHSKTESASFRYHILTIRMIQKFLTSHFHLHEQVRINV